MQRCDELFDSLKTQFSDDQNTIKLIDLAIRRTRDWIDENTPEEPERAPRKLGQVETQEKPQSARSIF